MDLSERFVQLGFILIASVTGLYLIGASYVGSFVPAMEQKRTLDHLSQESAGAEARVIAARSARQRKSGEPVGPYYLTYVFRAPDRVGNTRTFEHEQVVEEALFERYEKGSSTIPIIYYPADPRISA